MSFLRRAFLLAAAAAALCAAPARAQAGLEFTDWGVRQGDVVTGGLLGHPVALTGPTTVAGDVLDGTAQVFDYDTFTPRLARTDAVELARGTGASFTLSFGARVHDPVLQLSSLGSTLTFPAGTAIARVSGDDRLTVAGNVVTGAALSVQPNGQSDGNGTVRLIGSFTSIAFTAEPNHDGTVQDGIELQVGAVPAPAVPPAEPTPIPPPAPPARPVVTGVKAAAEQAAGDAMVLEATVAGDAQVISWDLDADGRSDVSCPGDEPALRFRIPPHVGARVADVRAVRVQAFGLLGAAGPVLAAPVQFGPAKVPGLSSSVAVRAAKLWVKDPSYLCAPTGDADRWLVSRANAKAQACVPSTLVAGALRARGCFREILKPEDLPRAEEVHMRALLGAHHLPDAAAALLDGVWADRATTINGLVVKPASGAVLVLNRQLASVYSANASLSAGGFALAAPPAFELVTSGRGDRIPVGTFGLSGGGRATLGYLDLDGSLGVDLVGGSDPHAEVRVHLKLPPVLGGLSVPVTARVNLDGRLSLTSLAVSVPYFQLGPISVTDFKIAFGADGIWHGQLRLCVISGVCIVAAPDPRRTTSPGIDIGPDSFRIYADVDFPGNGLPLATGVYLNSIGAGVAEPPLRLSGHGRITVSGLFDIDGGLEFAFPSHAAPYRIDSRLLGGFPPAYYQKPFERFTLAAAATAYVNVPLAGRVRLGNGYFLYQAPSLVSFGGGVNQDFLGVLKIIGITSGDFDGRTGRFNLHGHTDACIADIPLLKHLCWGSVADISSNGAGACVDIGPLSVGGGVLFHPFSVSLWPLDGCRWSPFAVLDIPQTAQAGVRVVRTRAGEPGRAIELRGRDGAPRVRVVTADGVTLESSAASGLAIRGGVRILRSERLKLTVIGIEHPATGANRIELLPGSPALTRTATASDQPPARAVASVRGRGARRTLVYRVARRRDQVVTFSDGGAPIATVPGGGRGRVGFTPAPGRGARRIEARFTLAGLPAERLTVARFRPPSPVLARPHALRVARSGHGLRVRWHAVPGASAYWVRAVLARGGEVRVRTRGRRATVRGVPRWSGGRVIVSALGPAREGTPSSVRFRAAGGRPPGVLRRLSGRARTPASRAASLATSRSARPGGAAGSASSGRPGGRGAGSAAGALPARPG